MLHGACVGEEAGARNRAFFGVMCKVASAGDERYVVRRVRLRLFHRRIGSPLVFCNVWLFMCA